MDDGTNYIVTDKKWDSNFDAALEMNPRLKFLKPEWVLHSHKNQQQVDIKKYLVEKKI